MPKQTQTIAHLLIFSMSLLTSSEFALAQSEVSTALQTFYDDPLLGTQREEEMPTRYVILRMNPIYMLPAQIYIGALDVGVARSWTLGPTIRGLENISLQTSNLSFHEVGLETTYYFGQPRSTNSFYLRLFYYFSNFTIGSASDGVTADQNFASKSAGFLIGYQWIYQSGFNLNVGFGAEDRYRISNVTLTSPDRSETEVSQLSKGLALAADFSLGWAF